MINEQVLWALEAISSREEHTHILTYTELSLAWCNIIKQSWAFSQGKLRGCGSRALACSNPLLGFMWYTFDLICEADECDFGWRSVCTGGVCTYKTLIMTQNIGELGVGDDYKKIKKHKSSCSSSGRAVLIRRSCGVSAEFQTSGLDFDPFPPFCFCFESAPRISNSLLLLKPWEQRGKHLYMLGFQLFLSLLVATSISVSIRFGSEQINI